MQKHIDHLEHRIGAQLKKEITIDMRDVLCYLEPVRAGQLPPPSNPLAGLDQHDAADSEQSGPDVDGLSMATGISRLNLLEKGVARQYGSGAPSGAPEPGQTTAGSQPRDLLTFTPPTTPRESPSPVQPLVTAHLAEETPKYMDDMSPIQEPFWGKRFLKFQKRI